MAHITPIIGIILDWQNSRVADGGFSDMSYYALRMNYAKAIVESGGVPIHISYEFNLIDEYARICDGFLIPGGEDMHPSYYTEEEVHPTVTLYENNDRTEFEIKLIRRIIEKQIPFLGICAGQQTLNVALGGTLYQDIDSQIKTTINHKHGQGQDLDWHSISIIVDSLLYDIVGEENYMVNSHHHQAIKDLGSGLKVTAIAPDGLIEAIEHVTHPFCIGVEWHPEHIKNHQDKKLIKAFVQASKAYAESK